jgi:hypothetical protein
VSKKQTRKLLRLLEKLVIEYQPEYRGDVAYRLERDLKALRKELK